MGVPVPMGDGVTRRQILATGGAATLATLATHAQSMVPGLSSASAILGGTPRHLRRSSFTPLVGDRFTIADGVRRPVGVRLVEVRDLSKRRALVGHDEAFALLFHGPGGPRLEQGVHRLRHPALGRFDLLVTPSGTGRRGQDYETVINRARPGKRG